MCYYKFRKIHRKIPEACNFIKKETLAQVFKGGSRTAAISKMAHFVIIVNGWKLHLGCCSSPRSASGCFPANFVKFIRKPFFIKHLWWLPILHLLQTVNLLKLSFLTVIFRLTMNGCLRFSEFAVTLLTWIYLQPFFENFLNFSWESVFGLKLLMRDLRITFEGEFVLVKI